MGIKEIKIVDYMKSYTINRHMKYVDEFINLNPLYFPDSVSYVQIVDEYVYKKLESFIKKNERQLKLNGLLND